MTPKHNHAEAFKLMSYACRSCGYEEKIWNSRDGVTPYAVKCPVCPKGESYHVNWQADAYLPEYIPERGQRVFVDMPESMKIVFARRRVRNFPPTNQKAKRMVKKDLIKAIVDDMHEGEPFIIIMP